MRNGNFDELLKVKYDTMQFKFKVANRRQINNLRLKYTKKLA